jgi:hypothetical protein
MGMVARDSVAVAVAWRESPRKQAMHCDIREFFVIKINSLRVLLNGRHRGRVLLGITTAEGPSLSHKFT